MLQKCASLSVNLQVLRETLLPCLPLSPLTAHRPESLPSETPSKATFIFCAFLFFTRPGRFFNLGPELLLFADDLDGAFFAVCPSPLSPQDLADCPPHLGALLPHFLLRGFYTRPHGGRGTAHSEDRASLSLL